MTPEQQRISIAVACGWLKVHGHSVAGIPDYLNDLNAMHEAEKVLTDEIENDEFERYCKKLSELCCPIKCGGSGCGFTITATASQRAEAFLRTIGKWEEAK
jgi:hypothetical protein